MRLLLADDHALVRGGLRALIAELPEIDEVVEAADGDEALAAVALHRPDIVLMDIAMPRLNGIQATSLILSIAPNEVGILESPTCNGRTDPSRGHKGCDTTQPEHVHRYRTTPV